MFLCLSSYTLIIDENNLLGKCVQKHGPANLPPNLYFIMQIYKKPMKVQESNWSFQVMGGSEGLYNISIICKFRKKNLHL